MSVHASGPVWKHTKSKGGMMLVLLALADLADNNGVAYPAVSTLREYTRLTTRQIKTNVRGLERLGELEVYIAAGPYGCNLYWVRCGRPDLAIPERILRARAEGRRQGIDAADEPQTGEITSPPNQSTEDEIISPPIEGAGGEVFTGGGEVLYRQGVKPTSPNPSLTHHEQERGDASERREGARIEALERLRTEIGEAAFKSWFTLVQWDDGADHRLIVPSRFHATHIRSQFADSLERLLGRVQIVVRS